jgi:hypothetical protein
MNPFPRIAFLGSALALIAPSGFAQQTPSPAAGVSATPRPNQAPLQIPDPHYVTVPMTIEVNAPADQVWARVGKFCDIGDWVPSSDGNTCKYLAGNGDAGTVRSVVNEVLVGKTKYSYTYTQAPRENRPYNLYHGTLEVVPVTATTSRLNYVLFFDTSMLTDDAREKYLKNRETSFNLRLKNMKTLAEGGTLKAPEPATPRPAEGARPAPAAYLSPNPHYVVIPMQLEVNAPADTVWSRIGHFCDIGKLGAIGYPTCMITSGNDGEYGVVRNIGREVLVGKTEHSYTYAQQLRATGFYSLYHGTIEAREVTPTKTMLYWTLVYDNSNLADDAAREKDIATRRTRFLGMMQNVKILSEGGTLPNDPVTQPTAPPSAK